jgi:hypothetical protein
MGEGFEQPPPTKYKATKQVAQKVEDRFEAIDLTRPFKIWQALLSSAPSEKLRPQMLCRKEGHKKKRSI